MKSRISSVAARLTIVATILSLGLSIAWSPVAAAQAAKKPAATPTPTTNNSGQALEIGPPVLNLTANPGQVLKAQISLRDVSSTKLLVKGQINDFTAAGEDGTPKVILDSEATDDNPYSMRKWITPLASLVLEPKQIRNLPVTINVPANAAPGGYYGVIRFTATPPELEGTGVSLSASLGSLLLVRVNGAVKEKLSVEEFSINKDGKTNTIFQSTPIRFLERLRNSGNLHEQPAGHVTVTDMFGKTVGAVNVNLPPRNILPGSIRRFEQPFDASVIGNKKLFGRYKAQLTVTYGTAKTEVAASQTFWVIPYTLIGILIVLLIVGFFTLRVLIRRYNRRIISQAQRSRRR